MPLNNKQLAERMYPPKKSHAGRVYEGDQRAKTRSYNSDKAQDLQADHDYILDSDGKVRKYKREKSA